MQSIISIFAGSLITFSPFLLFEIKHNFPNFQTIYEFVTRSTTHGYKTFNYIWLISNFGNIFIEGLTKLKGTAITQIAFWILTFGGIFGLVKNFKNKEKRLIWSIGLIWFIGGLAFLRFYTGQIFDYYLGFMYPVPFLMFGLIVSLFWQKAILKIMIVSLATIIIAYFAANGFYRSPPNHLIDQTEKVANLVIEKSEGKPFNFALITDHNSDHAYRYFLDIKAHKPHDLETMVTEQLRSEERPCRERV